jgi:cell division protein FtsI/penicillin-binding protein 2
MNESVFKRRVYVTALVLAVITVFFVIKLFNLHFSEKIILHTSEPLDTGRGYIADRNGYYLALSVEYDSIFANPSEILNKDQAALDLALATGLSSGFIRERLSSDKKFVWLRRKSDHHVIERVKALKIRGIYFRKEYGRVYPYDELASNISGFVGVDNHGLEGVEYLFDKILSGRDEIVRDETGREIYQRKNLRLTIDRFIQFVAEDELEIAIRRHGAHQCSVLIMEVNTGRVLAFAKKPSFNPNSFQNYSPQVRKNFSVTDTFEPGSTLKIMSLAALIENRPDALKKEYVCNGYVDINDVRINCLHKHGKLNITDVIVKSCNAGMIQSVRPLEKADMYKTLKKFGFGEKTGIEIPGEALGILRPVNQWSGLSKYSISIGHELSVTASQMAAAFNSIANGGVYISPTLIERIERPDGSAVKSFYPAAKGRVLSEEHARALLSAMRSVVKTGTGKRADSLFYEIAGKTGTSQKFSQHTGAYSDRNVSSFIGIAPFDKPVITMFVVFDDPGDSSTGGAVAAPVFARITERILPYLGIGGRDISGLTVKSTLKEKDRDYLTVPDFNGLGAGESLDILRVLNERNGIKYYIKGEGRVFAQKPAPGSRIQNNDNIIIFMR